MLASSSDRSGDGGWDNSISDMTYVLSAIHEDEVPISVESIREASATDAHISAIIDHLENGTKLPGNGENGWLKLWNLRSELTITDGCLFYKGRVVVPKAMQDRALAILHSAHQGTTGMVLHAEQSVFWPGITADIQKTRQSCFSCNRHAPSQSNLPSRSPIVPDYPFQHVCADYLDLSGVSYGVVVDRFSGWFHVYRSTGGAHGIVNSLIDLCRNFGVPETITTDGGPHFTARVTQDFFKQYGIQHRLSSVGNPHANSRAEVAVKTAKRLLRENTSLTGDINTVKMSRALLTHRNTPDRDTGLSPAQMILGRPLKGFLPNASRPVVGKAEGVASDVWRRVADWRELALAKRSSADQEKWDHQTHALPALTLGQHVMIQNAVGNNPRLWDKRGVVIKVLPFDQYEVMVDGSRRITLRNRKHLRKFTPIGQNKQTQVVNHPTLFNHSNYSGAQAESWKCDDDGRDEQRCDEARDVAAETTSPPYGHKLQTPTNEISNESHVLETDTETRAVDSLPTAVQHDIAPDKVEVSKSHDSGVTATQPPDQVNTQVSREWIPRRSTRPSGYHDIMGASAT
jgi:hypothetical protein